MSSPQNRKALIEAALYAAGRPLSLEELEKVSKARGRTETESLVGELTNEYRDRTSSLEIVQVSKGKYAFQLKPEYSTKVSRLSPGGLLSLGALKTLALIAIRQPVKQSEVINIRGSHSYEHIHKLEQLGFIKKQPSGRTVALSTTKVFAEYFGFDEEPIKLKVQLHRRLMRPSAKDESQSSLFEAQVAKEEAEDEENP
nr:SMC-Scp complex subunit ScpB [Candidatus Njordarchaeum guaymaensis]